MITSTFLFKLLKKGSVPCKFLSYEIFNMIKSLWSYLLFVSCLKNDAIEFRYKTFWSCILLSLPLLAGSGEELRQTRSRQTKHLGQWSARNANQYCFFGIEESHYAVKADLCSASSMTLSNSRPRHKHTENRLTTMYESIEL